MKDFILKNPVQKLLALSFAIIIWAFAPAPNKNLTEVKFFVPVSYVNLPKNLEITSEPLQSISVSVEIPRNDFLQIHPSLFQAVIDLDGASPGKKVYELTRDNLTTPPNVKVQEISPKNLTLHFEEIIEKKLPIKPVFVGELAKGYVLQEISMIPETVLVKGVISSLSHIDQLETKAINIDNVHSDIDMLIHIIFPQKVTPVEPKPEYYTAKIKVGSEPIKIRFLNIPIGKINENYITRINPSSFNVVLRGPRSLMQNFTKEDVQAYIDLQGYQPGNYKLKAPTLRLPPEIQIQQVWPPIRVWVKNQKIDD